MRKLFIIASMLAIAASCTVSEPESSQVQAPSFYAFAEGNDPTTKTTISVDAEGVGTIWWKPAEKINVFFGTTSVPYTSTNTVDATTVVFETTAMIGSTEGSSSNKWGLYPYDANATCNGSSVTTTIPSNQTCVAETFGTNLFPMVAQTSDNELHFLNVCGGIKFSLSREDIQSITFRDNNNEDLAGKVQITLGTDGKPTCSVVAGEQTLTLTPNSGSTFAKNTNYYIVILPTVLSNGFTMTFETASQIGTFNYTTKSIEIKRSIFGKKASIDTYAVFTSKEPCPDAVDLGLSVKWASFNLGASSPAESGYYYRWGEVENRKSGNYSFDNGFYLGLTKYCTNSNYGSFGAIQDNLSRLLPEDDAASVMLGDNWRMPTKDEWDELMRCEWRWTTNYSGTNVNGYLVIGTNGNSIFIPASGYYKFSSIYDSGSRGYYWTSDLFADSYKAYRADFYEGQHGTTGFERTNFLPIRAVYDEKPSMYVDLGLSVKWATCNLGANKPEEYGGYYQWAGLEDVTDTSISVYWNNCPYHTGSSSNTGWTKYNNESSSGTVDNKTDLDLEDDVAHLELGAKWRIPTYDELQELIDNCTIEFTSMNDVNGQKYTSKKNGNSIFLPAAGHRDSRNIYSVGSSGRYWSSSLGYYPYQAYGIGFNSSNSAGRQIGSRYAGYSIRPVTE